MGDLMVLISLLILNINYSDRKILMVKIPNSFSHDFILFMSRWWWAILIVLAFAIVVGIVIRYIELTRIKTKMQILEHQQALEHERLRIARDMHDEVGASLTEISILCELINKNLSNMDVETARLVRQISAKSRKVIDNIGEIIWAINPVNDGLENVVAYIRRFIGNYLREVPIECNYDIPDNIPELHLSAEVRRNVFLTIKEALNNIIKHASASKIYLSIMFMGNKIDFIIKDNGIGMKVDENKNFGNGLKNMKLRMSEAGGMFSYKSDLGEGTEIKLSLNVEGN